MWGEIPFFSHELYLFTILFFVLFHRSRTCTGNTGSGSWERKKEKGDNEKGEATVKARNAEENERNEREQEKEKMMMMQGDKELEGWQIFPFVCYFVFPSCRATVGNRRSELDKGAGDVTLLRACSRNLLGCRSSSCALWRTKAIYGEWKGRFFITLRKDWRKGVSKMEVEGGRQRDGSRRRGGLDERGREGGEKEEEIGGCEEASR